MKTKTFILKIMIFVVILIICPMFTFAQNVVFYSIPNPAQISNDNLRDVWGFDANNVFVVGDNGMFLKYNGSVAIQILNPSTEILCSVSGYSADDVWAVGFNGTAVHYNGSNITVYNVGTSSRLRSVKVFSPSNVWASGQNGVISHWDGNLWTIISNPYPNFEFVQISGTDAKIYFSGGDVFYPYTSRIYSFDGINFMEVFGDPTDRSWSRISTQDDNLFYLFGITDTYSLDKSTGIVTKIYESGSYGSYVFGTDDLLIVGGDSGTVSMHNNNWRILNGIKYVAVHAPQNEKSDVYFVGNGGIFFHCDLTTGISEQIQAPNKFNVYPNPASDQITIDLAFDKKNNTKIELFDLVGKQVKLVSSFVSNEAKNTVDVSDLSSGTYFIKLTTESGNSFTRKIVVTK